MENQAEMIEQVERGREASCGLKSGHKAQQL
jgi:hypothetical protein